MSAQAQRADNKPDPAKALGARIRAFRTGRRLSLRALADQTQTSPGFLSQLERGQVNASVSTMRKLADGLGISLPDMFSEQTPNAHKILRRADRVEIHASHLTMKYLISQTPLLNLEVYAAEFQPGGNAGEPFNHGDAQEIVVVTAGVATLFLDGMEYTLEVGDSAEYTSSSLHTIRNYGDVQADVLWIISPPTGRLA